MRRGEVFGLLGPNGAGKTTTVGVLTTRVTRTSGLATVAGIDVAAEPRRRRAPCSGSSRSGPNLDRSLDARGNLVWHAAYHGVPRAQRGRLADELLERMGLAEKAKHQPGRALRRPGPAPDHRARPDARPAGALPRRAVDGPRPAGAPLRARPRRRARGVRRHGRAHDPRHGRGGQARRPRRHRRPRQAARAGHAVGARGGPARRGHHRPHDHRRRRRDCSRGGSARCAVSPSVEDRHGERHRPPPTCAWAATARPAWPSPRCSAPSRDAGAVVSQVELGEPTLEDVFIDLTGRGLR